MNGNSPLIDPPFALAGIRAQIRDLRTETIANLALRARELGDVIALWYGEGDMTTPAFIREAAKAAFDEGLTFYIPNMRGHGPLNQALSDYQSRLHGRPIPIERTTVTPGGMQALFMALELLVDVGTNVVYVEPQWPNIHNAIHLTAASRGPSRWISTATSGSTWTGCSPPATRAPAPSSCRRHPTRPAGRRRARRCWRCSTSAAAPESGSSPTKSTAGSIFDGEVAPSILQVAEDGDRVLSVNSFSKAWAMTGWRVGWLTHPSAVADQLGAMTQYINSGTAGPIQAGAVAAIRQGEPLVTEIRERITHRPRPRL